MRKLLYMNTIKFLILLHERFRATEQKMHRKRMKSVYLFGFLQVCFISDDGFLSLDQLHFQIGAVICQLTLDLQCTFESDEVMTKKCYRNQIMIINCNALLFYINIFKAKIATKDRM